MSDANLRERTKRTAQMLFHSLKGGTGFETWKKFDKELARELSMFFTGTLYSREVITQVQRELCAVASLTVLHRPHELRAHIHAALNVGATREQVAEVVFQQVTYGGMPVVVDALARLTPQPFTTWAERADMRRFFALRMPCTYIRCLRDQAVTPARAAEYAARLGVTPIDMDCAHNPMLSAVDELAKILTKLN